MKLRNLRWWIAALIFASTVINYIDRQALSVVAPVLTRDLGISQIEYGSILQWFLVAYTVMALLVVDDPADDLHDKVRDAVYRCPAKALMVDDG